MGRRRGHLFHDTSFSLAKSDMAPTLVLDVLDVDLTTAGLFRSGDFQGIIVLWFAVTEAGNEHNLLSVFDTVGFCHLSDGEHLRNKLSDKSLIFKAEKEKGKREMICKPTRKGESKKKFGLTVLGLCANGFGVFRELI